MKKTMFAAMVAMVAGVSMADGWSVVATGGVSRILFPASDPTLMTSDGTNAMLYTAAAWASNPTNAVAQGAYVLNASKRYWTPNGGISTNAPTHAYGVASGADGVVWVNLNKYHPYAKIAVSLDNPLSSVYINDNAAASTTSGEKLQAGHTSVEYEGFFGYASVTAPSNAVTVLVRAHY